MRRVALLVAMAAVGACGGGGQSPGSGAGTPTVTALSISGPAVLQAIGEIESFTATATMSDGSTRDETSAVTWRSSDPGVATVNLVGHVTAVAAGTADISIALAALSARESVRVVPPNWTLLAVPNAGSPDRFVGRIAIDPRDERVIYAGTEQGLYVTTDAGRTWSRRGTGFVRDIEIDPANPDRVWASLSARLLVRSTDRGATFAGVKDFVQDYGDFFLRVLRSAIDARTLYVAYGGTGDPNPSGTFKSTDDGATWVRQPYGRDGALITWVLGEDAVTGALYAGTEIGDHPQPYHPPFFTSPDGGKTWLDATNGLPWHVVDMFVNADDHSVLAMTEGPGLYKSTDGAKSWTRLNTVFANDLGVDPREPSRMFAGSLPSSTGKASASASYDGGKTFYGYGLETLNVTGFAFNATSTRLYAACYGSGIYVTDIEAPPR